MKVGRSAPSSFVRVASPEKAPSEASVEVGIWPIASFAVAQRRSVSEQSGHHQRFMSTRPIQRRIGKLQMSSRSEEICSTPESMNAGNMVPAISLDLTPDKLDLWGYCRCRLVGP
jgi:hypothetical protein